MSVVSISRVKLFKACRRAYELKYIYGLEPVEKAEALETGLTYHQKLEELYRTGDVDISDMSRESAMAMAHKKYLAHALPMRSVEEPFEFLLPNGDKLVGRIDGILKTGTLVEHKTTSQDIGPEYEYSLMWDEQILAYMLATGSRRMWHTACRKPTIRQKKNETKEEFFQRMVDWYDDDTLSKILMIFVERTDEEINQFALDLRRIIYEINHCGLYYRNTAYCTRYGRRCEYASVCLHYDPNLEYIEFTRRERE